MEINKEMIEEAAKKIAGDMTTVRELKGITDAEMEAVYSLGFNFYRTGNVEGTADIHNHHEHDGSDKVGSQVFPQNMEELAAHALRCHHILAISDLPHFGADEYIVLADSYIKKVG